ncbi:MAG: tandem-95 repeat protein, partial [Bradymonadales bacterium]|nr:tandem-95 repeat protein [Bradymonadales bacterium]
MQPTIAHKSRHSLSIGTRKPSTGSAGRWPLACTSLLALLALLALGPVAAAQEAVIYVTTCDDDFDAISADTDCSLREAIEAANTGADFGGCTISPATGAVYVIELPAWTYQLTQRGTADYDPTSPLGWNSTNDLDIFTSLNIRGPEEGRAIIDGYGFASGEPTTRADRVIQIHDSGNGGTVVHIERVTITNGLAGYIPQDTATEYPSDPRGGGIFNAGTLTLSDVVVSQNYAISADPSTGDGQAALGGGIFSLNDLILEDSAVGTNYAIGIVGWRPADLNYDDPMSMFHDPDGSPRTAFRASGGGIYILEAPLVLTGSVTGSSINDNLAAGGDDYCSASSPIICGATGGGVFANYATIDIQATELVGNWAVGAGGDDFSSGSSALGGAIYGAGYVVVKMAGAYFWDNGVLAGDTDDIGQVQVEQVTVGMGEALGGALFVDMGHVSVETSEFLRNFAQAGTVYSNARGASAGDAAGGAIALRYLWDTEVILPADPDPLGVFVGDSTFSDNWAYGGQVVGTAVTNTTGGDGMGGAIYVDQSSYALPYQLQISNGCQLENNWALGGDVQGSQGEGGGAYGGAIWVASPYPTSTPSQGDQALATALILESNLTSNVVIGGYATPLVPEGTVRQGYGGIAAGGAVFMETGGERDDGALWADNTWFLFNYAVGGRVDATDYAVGGDGFGGGLAFGPYRMSDYQGDQSGLVELTSCLFHANEAWGGIAALVPGESSEPQPLQATYAMAGSGEGGGVAVSYAVIDMQECEISENWAIGGDVTGSSEVASTNGGLAFGGGISRNAYNHTQLPLFISSTWIEYNLAEAGYGSSLETDLDPSCATSGDATGGGLHSVGGLQMDNTVVYNNYALAAPVHSKCQECEAYGGWAFGGGLSVENGPTELDNVWIEGNSAEGGAATALAEYGRVFGGRSQGGGAFFSYPYSGGAYLLQTSVLDNWAYAGNATGTDGLSNFMAFGGCGFGGGLWVQAMDFGDNSVMNAKENGNGYDTLFLEQSTVSLNGVLSDPNDLCECNAQYNLAEPVERAVDQVSDDPIRCPADGGGILFGGHELYAENSTISSNIAHAHGGGLAIESVEYSSSYLNASLVNTTVTSNLANALGDGKGIGGGIFLMGDYLNQLESDFVGPSYLLEYTNSIIAGNFVGTAVGDDLDNDCDWVAYAVGTSYGSNLLGLETGCPDMTDYDIVLDPALVHTSVLDPALADNGGPTPTHALAVNSPAIDAVANCELLVDQRGEYRDCPDACDIGAFEFHNRAPVASDIEVETPEDTPVVIDLLGNVTDPDPAEVLSIVMISGPAHGTVTQDNGTVTYTPHPEFFGPDTFSYVVTDAGGLSDWATVSIEVLPVNDDPMAVDDTAFTPQNEEVTIDVLANDYDLDGDPMTITDVTTPEYGATAIGTVEGGDQVVIYTPDDAFLGYDSFQYTIDDGNSGTAHGTVMVVVGSLNYNPITVADTATTDEDTPVTIDVLDNDTDDNPATDMSVEAVGQGSHGTVTINADDTVT